MQLRVCARFLAATAGLLLAPTLASPQATPIPSRITQAVDETRLTILRGNTHPLARAEFDRGAASSSLAMHRMLLVLQRSADQESALETLMEQQQDASSPNFHKWLTPQQFGQQFGPSDQDIQTITSWLQSHGFQIAGASNGRTVIEFSGTAGQVAEAFHTTIHKYAVNGEEHWANSSDPQIPSALAPVVAGINTLYNFPRQEMHEMAGVFSRTKATGAVTSEATSLFTFPNPCSPNAQPYCNFALDPADFAKIYNVPNLLLSPAPATQFNGDGVTIAIVGQSDINPSDVSQFRTLFGLPAPKLNVIVSGPDPSFNGAETEADLDLQWAGAVAPNATIDFVIAEDTEVSLGVDLAAQYAVDNNLGAVLSESFGICELFMGAADNQFYTQLWQQAAAQGTTVMVSAGDSGSAVCNRGAGPATLGLAVSGFTSTPYNVSVGGTDFNDINNFSTFWNTTPSDTPTVASAKGYIPEMTWNDSCTNQEIFSFFGTTTAEQTCNNATAQQDGFVLVIGGSGGKSNCINSDGQNVSSCTQGHPKPSWQTALTPQDGVRDVPDVSFFASNGFNGSFYLICESDLNPSATSCDPYAAVSDFVGIGGTSASSPAFAGIMALVNQATGSRQGNANYILYKLAGQAGNTCTSAANPASTCVFYDVPSGSTIAMPCANGSPNCTVSTAGDSIGVLSGYATSSGYDLATGLGSVNAANLIGKWKNFSLTPSTTALTLNNGSPVNITHGESVPVSISVTGTGGTPSGNASLIANEEPNGAAGTGGVQGFSLNSSGDASGSTTSLPGGSYTVFAKYAGDGTFAGSTSATQSVTVAPEASKMQIAYELFDPNTGLQTNPNATTAMYGTPSLLRVNATSQAGDACPNNAPGNTGCPTGNITLADSYNGAAAAPLDGGTFALNAQGYTEDQAIDLLGGTHNLTATYVGDNSFGASNANATITITRAATTTNALFNPPVQTLVIGAPSAIDALTHSQSLGVAPSGNYSVLDGNTVIGTNSVLGFAGSPSQGALCQGSITFGIAAPSGPHTLTVQYSGDTNYAASTSSSVTVNAVYPVTVSVTANPSSVVYGNTVTVTATVDTGNPASNAALKPTGTVSLSSTYGSITPVTTTVTQDGSGNWMLQATATTTPQQSEYISANYSGDPNYEALGNSNPLFVNVTIPDFSVSASPPALTIIAGQMGTTTLTVTPTTNNKSTVALSCGGVGYVIPGASCSFSPSSVTLTNGASATTAFSLSTPPPSNSTTAMGAPILVREVPLISAGRGAWWALGVLSGLASLLMFAIPVRRYRYCGLGLFLLCGLSFAAGCGGGGGNSGGGGGGGGGNGLAPTTTTLSTPTTKVAPGAGLMLTATVNSSKPTTGTVTFSSQSCGFTSFVNLVNGTAQVQLAPSVAICDVTATYSGDANNLPSQSGSLSIVFTGTAGETVNAQTGPDTHTIQVNITLQ